MFEITGMRRLGARFRTSGNIITYSSKARHLLTDKLGRVSLFFFSFEVLFFRIDIAGRIVARSDLLLCVDDVRARLGRNVSSAQLVSHRIVRLRSG